MKRRKENKQASREQEGVRVARKTNREAVKTGRERGRTRKQSLAPEKELGFEKVKEKGHLEGERRFYCV